MLLTPSFYPAARGPQMNMAPSPAAAQRPVLPSSDRRFTSALLPPFDHMQAPGSDGHLDNEENNCTDHPDKQGSEDLYLDQEPGAEVGDHLIDPASQGAAKGGARAVHPNVFPM